MMVESMFALVKNGKLYVRKTTNGVFIKLTLHADCWATIIMVSIIKMYALLYNLILESHQGQV